MSKYRDDYQQSLEECLYDILRAAKTPKGLTRLGLSRERAEEIFSEREPLLVTGPIKTHDSNK